MTTGATMKPLCPECGSRRTTFRKKAGIWECRDCESRFQDSSASGRRLLSDVATKPRAIFFSYGHDEHRELVELFRRDLEKRGHKVWIDYKEIGTWDDWRGSITEGINQSDIAIAFLSAHSTRDPGVCRSEIAMALHHFGTIFPILLEPASRVSVPITISHLQWPDLSDWQRIRAGKVRGTDWKRWYEAKLIEIVSRIEGERARFAEEVNVLRQVLKPASFESKFAEHIDGFVGRQWVFKEYEKWLAHQPKSRLFWIEAGPGFGKTAVAANLSYRNRAAIAATWFCDAASSDLSDAGRALRSIAFQLALRWDDYRARLLAQSALGEKSTDQQIADARTELDRMGAADLFRRLLAEPISGLIWREHKLVILIDALDEATEPSGTNSLVDLLSQHLTSLPAWIGFVVTSRPEAAVVNRLKGFLPFRIESDDARNQADLKAYCDHHLAQHNMLASLPDRTRRRLIEGVIKNSGGLILYIKMVEEGLSEQSLQPEKIDKIEAGLPGLYRRYFVSFQHRFADQYTILAQPLLRLLMSARGPLPHELAREALNADSESFLSMRNRIGSYVSENGAGLQLFHNTLREWLSTADSGPFHVDRQIGSRQLGEVLWREFAGKPDIEGRWPALVLDWLPDFLPLTPPWGDFEGLRRFGSYLAANNRFSSSRVVLERCISLASERKLEFAAPDTIAALSQLVIVSNRLADLGLTGEAERSAATLSTMTHEAAQIASLLVRGYCNRRVGNLKGAREAYDSAPDDRVRLIFPSLVLRAKFQKAHAIHLSGMYDEATKVYEEIAGSEAQAEEEIDARETARRQLGDLLMLRGRFRDALTRFRESAAYASRDPLWGFECQRFIGHVHRFNWMLDAAEQVYTPIAEECERRGIVGMLGKALVNLAETTCWTQATRAKGLAVRAAELNEQTGNTIEVGKALTALAIAHLRAGESGKAVDASVRAETLQRQVGYKSGIVFAAGARALAQHRLRRPNAVRDALNVMDLTTRETGVYRFLFLVYSSACGQEAGLKQADFDWLDGADVNAGIELMSSR